MNQNFLGRFIFLFLILLLGVDLNGQTLKTETMELSALSERISRDSVEHHLRILADDDMEGREAGYPGNKKAAQYLAEKLQSYGFQTPPRTRGYFQEFPIYKQSFKSISLEIGQHAFESLVDFCAYPSENPNLPGFEAAEIVYLGYGLPDDFKGKNLNNKVIMIEEGYPEGIQGRAGRNGRLAPPKVQAANQAGVRLILVVAEDFDRHSRQCSNETVMMSLRHVDGANIVYVSPRIAARIMKGQEDRITQYRNGYDISASENASGSDRQPVTIRRAVEASLHKVTEYSYIPNVVGYLPGKDPELRHELLVLSAHFDHLGTDGTEIYNGADDDGSGVSSILEIGRIISELSRENEELPRRSLLILFANAEEKGLVGSAYYTDHPIFPLENTITNLNVDMIGRRDEHHQDNPYYVYIIGSDKLSRDLHDINELVNDELTNLELDYRYNDDADPNRFYYRSDHYNFAKNDVPVIFYFTGVHEDYHQPTDTVEKIEFGKMITITKLIFGTAWELLNNDQRPILD